MGDEKKYEFTDETRELDGVTVKRIRALRDVGRNVKAGDLGGFIKDEMCLSHRDRCWVFGDAVVMENALVMEDAQIGNDALVRRYARVCGRAQVVGDAIVTDWAVLTDDAYVSGSARVLENAHVYGRGTVEGEAMVMGRAGIGGNTVVYDDAVVGGTQTIIRNGQVGFGATIGTRNDVIVIEGLLDEAVTVYRADHQPDGHLVKAGCQTFKLTRSAEQLAEIARVHGWRLPPGWKGMRAALMVSVRAWQRQAREQDASKRDA